MFTHGVHNVKLKTLLARGFQEWRRRHDGDALAGDVVNDAGNVILISDLLIPRREEKSTVFFGQSSCRERRMQHSNAAMSGIFRLPQAGGRHLVHSTHLQRSPIFEGRGEEEKRPCYVLKSAASFTLAAW